MHNVWIENSLDHPPLERLGSYHPELVQLVRTAGQGKNPLLFLHIDIDHFNAINENMSVEVGDKSLVLIARRLQLYLGDRGHLWRHGSDELVVVIRREDQTLPYIALAEQIRQQLLIPLSVIPYTLYLSGSIGLSLCPEHAKDTSRLLDYAEDACLQARKQGGNTIYVYTPNNQKNIHIEKVMTREIVEAINRDELCLRYQPLVSAQDGHIVGLETQLRWQSPTLGMLTPERFMHSAERLGLIIQIGQWVIKHAVHQTRKWRDLGFTDFTIYINVSTLQLLRPSFTSEVLAVLQACGLPSEFLTFEINESILSNNVQTVFETMANLRKQGIGLCLDNFGTGNSSLTELIRYPVDQLKIDRSFIKSTPSGNREAAIAGAIISMAHQLGMTVIANGVESRAHVGFLRRNECDIFQGYLFAEPLSTERVAIALRNRYLQPESFIQTHSDRTLLLLDDEENMLRSLIRLFRRDGYRIFSASNVREAFEILASNEVHVILSDQRMPDMNGTEFLGRVKMLYPYTIRLVLSGYIDIDTVTEAINHGAVYRYLTKPWDDEHLREHIRQAFNTFDKRKVAKHNRDAHTSLTP